MILKPIPFFSLLLGLMIGGIQLEPFQPVLLAKSQASWKSPQKASPTSSQRDQQATYSNISTRSSGVFINGRELSKTQINAIAQTYRVSIPVGRYWYDRQCGAWGITGGPVLGFTQAGLPYGGPLRADASGGGTGVFVNGRELHPQDVAALMQCTPVYPGRYWVNANGIGGFEGGPAQFDLKRLCQGNRRPGRSSGLIDYGSVIAGDGFIGFIDSEGRSFTSGN